MCWSADGTQRKCRAPTIPFVLGFRPLQRSTFSETAVCTDPSCVVGVRPETAVLFELRCLREAKKQENAEVTSTAPSERRSVASN